MSVKLVVPSRLQYAHWVKDEADMDSGGLDYAEEVGGSIMNTL
jgi:hypothetical protein